MISIDEAVRAAEKKIQAILLELDDEQDLQIESVTVDTRPYGNYAVSILTEPVDRKSS